MSQSEKPSVAFLSHGRLCGFPSQHKMLHGNGFAATAEKDDSRCSMRLQ